MKALWKTMLSAACFCIFAAVGVHQDAFAAVYNGVETSFDGALSYTWTVDTEKKTLTLDGNDVDFFYFEDNVPWAKYESQIDHLELKGNGYFPGGGSAGLIQSLDRIVDTAHCSFGDGFSYTLNRDAKTLTYEGNGECSPSLGWRLGFLIDGVETVIIGDGITRMDFTESYDATLVLGDQVQFRAINNGITTSISAKAFVVSENNPYYASYEGGLYSKDYSSLLRSPKGTSMKFHPDVKYLEAYSMQISDGMVVLPWGLKTVNGGALCELRNTTVVFPDTLTYIGSGNNTLPDARVAHTVTYIYSKGNKVALETLTGYTGAYGETIAVQVVDSVAKYYPEVSPSEKMGWVEENGKAYYYDETGKPITNQWLFQNNKWYYFGSDGAAVKGWLWDKNYDGWFYLLDDYSMVSDRQTVIDGVTYQFYANGKMASSAFGLYNGQWYYYNAAGAMVKDRWVLHSDGRWYYLANDGHMASNTFTDDGYYVNENGAWESGMRNQWFFHVQSWHYLDGNAKTVTGWLTWNSKQYYFYDTGDMLTGWLFDNGSYYYFGSDGAMLRNQKTPDGYYVDQNGKWIR